MLEKEMQFEECEQLGPLPKMSFSTFYNLFCGNLSEKQTI